ncbi:hypothetical protein F6X56_01115 (plasmid) [Rhodococcus erythropolis]|nr:hypothetical protein F6X56_01115 [Rhodococcus erythropolis]
MNGAQLTLFGIERGDVVALREWSERMVPALWTAPWDCADGIQKGAVLSGWQCPACGVVEPNAYLLDNNHGLDPERPGREDRLTRCLRMELREDPADDRHAQ